MNILIVSAVVLFAMGISVLLVKRQKSMRLIGRILILSGLILLIVNKILYGVIAILSGVVILFAMFFINYRLRVSKEVIERYKEETKKGE